MNFCWIQINLTLKRIFFHLSWDNILNLLVSFQFLRFLLVVDLLLSLSFFSFSLQVSLRFMQSCLQCLLYISRHDKSKYCAKYRVHGYVVIVLKDDTMKWMFSESNRFWYSSYLYREIIPFIYLFFLFLIKMLCRLNVYANKLFYKHSPRNPFIIRING